MNEINFTAVFVQDLYLQFFVGLILLVGVYWGYKDFVKGKIKPNFSKGFFLLLLAGPLGLGMVLIAVYKLIAYYYSKSFH